MRFPVGIAHTQLRMFPKWVSIGTDEEKKAVKDAKKTKLEDLVELEEVRKRLEEERFKYEKERDDRNMKHLKKKEANRHKETIQRLQIMELKMRKDLGLKPEARSTCARRTDASLERKRSRE
jgi:hypothetical protein